MRLLAISDLHLASARNREALQELPESRDDGAKDWIVLAGDVSERFDHLEMAFDFFSRRFAKVIWVPGNHELWSTRKGSDGVTLRGEERYRAIVELAHSRSVITPESEYPLWTGAGGPCTIVPMFLLYDYSFRPPDITRDQVVSWAAERRSVCADEVFLSPAPYASREDWCHERVRQTLERLEKLDPAIATVLVNHFPLRSDLIRIPRAPRFTPWCGTTITEDWHRRFRAKVAVSGHLHVRRTDWRDGTRFEEVSLGHPAQWDQERGIASYFREILPGPAVGGGSQS